jgi:predicted ester cyclase
VALEANKALARRFREEVVGGGDQALAAQLLADDFVYHGPDAVGDLHGRDAFLQLLGGFRAGLPDMAETPELQLAEGDLVAQRVLHRSTHRGELMGVAPTGNAVTARSIEILRIADGRIAECWITFDLLALLQAIGAVRWPP